jgi:hypothetical protein
LDSQQELLSTAALGSMVQHCLDAFGFEPGLKQAWVSVSLDWALHARSRHLACRSQQVMRSLRPQLTGDMCSILLLCLQQCLAAAEGSAVARDVALEVLLTLRELLESLPAHKLLLYPQVRDMCWEYFCPFFLKLTVGLSATGKLNVLSGVWGLKGSSIAFWEGSGMCCDVAVVC